MGRISKKLLLCLLAVSSLTVSGSVYADSEGSEAAPQAALAADKGAEPEKAKRYEAVEKAELSAEDAEKYLRKLPPPRRKPSAPRQWRKRSCQQRTLSSI